MISEHLGHETTDTGHDAGVEVNTTGVITDQDAGFNKTSKTPT